VPHQTGEKSGKGADRTFTDKLDYVNLTSQGS
jgi:hypothetical protein